MQKLLKTMAVMLLTTLSASLAAAPDGYSITADSQSDFTPSLFRIDLATGTETLIGSVKLQFEDKVKRDVEGLAFSPDGILYGVDDESRTLFPLSIETGEVQSAGDVLIPVLPIGGGNDFGLTFACDDNLYLTSIAKGSLYRLGLDGTTTLIGSENGLGVKINALAAYGDPVDLYGLGNGVDGNGVDDSPNLYTINLANGEATKIGSGLGDAAGKYTEGGLAFDAAGQLWAILESQEKLLPSPSRIVKIDTATGVAFDAHFASEVGYESLAITKPQGCSPISNFDDTESYQGVPALSHYGLLLFSALILLTGMVATRRY